MKASASPKKLTKVFSENGEYNTIAVNSSSTSLANGAATYESGFPPLTMTAVSNGGIPPSGKDFNGILRHISGHSQFYNAGYISAYDSSFSSSIGGYPAGSVVTDMSNKCLWLNTADDNKKAPTASSSGWVRLTTQLDVTPISLGGTGATTADNARKNLGLKTVASSGKYSDLTGTPDLAKVATSGSYNDLSNKPYLGSAAPTTLYDADAHYNQLPWGSGYAISAGTVRNVINHLQDSGAVGSFAFAMNTRDVQINFGDTVNGSTLIPTSADSGFDQSRLSGTWRCLGGSNGASDKNAGRKTTLYVRIS